MNYYTLQHISDNVHVRVDLCNDVEIRVVDERIRVVDERIRVVDAIIRVMSYCQDEIR